MLKLIYGPPSSGKTYYTDTLVLKALKSGKKAFLIVPEQEAIEAENRIYDRAAASGVFTERLSVVSFRRLADLTFRKYGGIEYSDIGEGGKLVLLWKCISEASPELCHFKNTSDRAFVELMKSVCDELKRYCVTPSQLSAVADKLSDGRFGKKLNDVAYIYAKFNTALINNSLDSVDDVSRLADILKKEHPDPEATYFIDSFNGFTRPEFSVIESLCEYSDVYVTVNRFKEDGRTGFMTVESTEKELKELSAYTTVETEAVLDGKDFNGHAEFELIRNSLYGSYKPSTDTAPSERISFYACKDAFSQAEIIAINIKKLIRSGARYRDIAVISRNADAYEGTLDVVFGKYGIPLFLSSRSPMLKTDLYRAVSSALDIILGGFRSEDVMTYIKSGVCGFTLEEIDIIESYVSLWNINGKRWTEEDDWIMNPHGFYFTDSDDASTLERTDALLATVNSVRRRITAPLTELKEDIKGSTVKEACAALYRFITKSGITDHYLTADSVGVTVYNTFIKMLDSLVKVAGELTVNAQTLSSLLHLMAKNTDYGRIPSTFDSVIAGDASIIRCNGVKHVFLTDCESGKFPATVTDDSFFSENEKELLRSHKLTVAPRISERNDLEAFYFLRSAGEATETLTATFCVSGSEEYPSQGFERLTELFPNNPVQHYPSETAVTDRIQTENTALEAYAALKKTDRAELLDEVFGELGISTSLSETPISDANAFLSRQTVNTLFGNGINMTATRLEAYVKCPFSYFCGNVLKLAAKKHSFFAASDMGVYIHRVLELSLKKLYTDHLDNNVPDSAVPRAVDHAIDATLANILRSDGTLSDGRFQALINRLRNSSLILVDNIVREFRKSSFRPTFFEYKIGGKDSALAPLEFNLDNGNKISVYGTIDRVDTFRNGANAFVRVVDYKTGSTEHLISNVKYGIDTQMLLYLFSITKGSPDKFIKDAALDGATNVYPAGVLYQPAKPKLENTVMPESEETALPLSDKNLRRNGIVLNDVDIISAMENDIAGKFIPVKLSKDSLKSGSDVLVDPEGFDKLLESIEQTFKRIGDKMLDGNGCASPLNVGSIKACKYCNFASICRSKTEISEEEGGESNGN